ncbi:GNAT family N-acetyltransferase [Novosphingobium sp. Gsoil 351]|uniref:GNAT family N-acetyltransferase n=1 Tax=Novosphingobium sp. Gsoil 351 TaxID=2675225 RepID=UPI0012B4A6EB|nr:GNAT family N-acetyltransferase [Novosphingobium sp. Gsoil 351]QGN54658.1 GNAT family N-acetyltransferase [Novosphingobium sp. Gsoil 351]
MSGLRIRDYDASLAGDFARINRQWIEEMYALEPVDEAQLADPHGQIVAPGGAVLFAEDEALGIVGTCGLLKTSEGEFELIKMAVLPQARARGAGEALLRAAIARAFALSATRLFLLTNSKSQAAIRLYERNGFVHDAEVLARCGGEYSRCDVAMRYIGEGATAAS